MNPAPSTIRSVADLFREDRSIALRDRLDKDLCTRTAAFEGLRRILESRDLTMKDVFDVAAASGAPCTELVPVAASRATPRREGGRFADRGFRPRDFHAEAVVVGAPPCGDCGRP